MTLVDNIVSVYLTATPDSVESGMTWYETAHDFAQSLDPLFHRSAGVIAALSPMNGWKNNKRKAALLYSQGHGAGCGLYKNVAKAERIMAGEDALDVLGGRKVRSFYLSIVDPASEIAEPVIDRHAFDLAKGRVSTEKERSILGRKGVYDRFSSAYVRAARAVNITPKQLQAVTWCEWRRRQGIHWAG